jgi:hypothetical protein
MLNSCWRKISIPPTPQFTPAAAREPGATLEPF